jgi:hypothetical protein
VRPWEIWSWKFPDEGLHPAVVLGTEDRLKVKRRVSVLLCSSQRVTRQPEPHEVILDQADGLDWPTLCKCDLVHGALKSELTDRRGSVTPERRRAIAFRLIQQLGLAGL